MTSKYRLTTVKSVVGIAAACLLLAIVAAPPAFAAAPWWQVSSSSTPTNMPPGGEGQIVVAATNLGDTEANGAAVPVRITDKLPRGMEAIAVSGSAGPGNFRSLLAGASVSCPASPLAPGTTSVSCTYEGALPPYEFLDVDIAVKVESDAPSGEDNEATVAGGEAPGVSVRRPVTVSGMPTPFGVENYELRPGPTRFS
jgi:hypothetical protein